MKIFLEKDHTVIVNGEIITVNSGTQDIDNNIGQILIQAGYAKAIEEEKKKK